MMPPRLETVKRPAQSLLQRVTHCCKNTGRHIFSRVACRQLCPRNAANLDLTVSPAPSRSRGFHSPHRMADELQTGVQLFRGPILNKYTLDLLKPELKDPAFRAPARRAIRCGNCMGEHPAHEFAPASTATQKTPHASACSTPPRVECGFGVGALTHPNSCTKEIEEFKVVATSER